MILLRFQIVLNLVNNGNSLSFYRLRMSVEILGKSFITLNRLPVETPEAISFDLSKIAVFSSIFAKTLRQTLPIAQGSPYDAIVQIVHAESSTMSSSEPLLRTQQVAEALGVSVSSIKRWADTGDLRVARTLGKHRLILVSEAIRFARSKGLPQSGLERLSVPAVETVDGIDERLCDRLTSALRRGDIRGGRGVIVSAYAAGCGAEVLADQLIRPVMEEVGHGWEDGSIDVFQEHMASHVVASALIELNEQASRSLPASAPVALGATPEGDPYVLPLLLGELTLREQGWDVRNLGVNLPLRSLAAAVRGYRPGLVFLSVNYLTDPDGFVKDYMAFYRSAADVGTAVVLGGRALGPDLRARLVYAAFGDRMAHLAEFARRLAPVSRDTGAPEQHGSANP